MASTTAKVTRRGEKRVERFDIELEISEQDRQRFTQSPQDFLKEQLEKNGLKVNRILVDNDTLIELFTGARASGQWYHIQYCDERPDLVCAWEWIRDPKVLKA
jgi:hypothetical protein